MINPMTTAIYRWKGLFRLQLQRDKGPSWQLAASMVKLRVHIFKNKYKAQRVERKLGKH